MMSEDYPLLNPPSSESGTKALLRAVSEAVERGDYDPVRGFKIIPNNPTPPEWLIWMDEPPTGMPFQDD